MAKLLARKVIKQEMYKSHPEDGSILFFNTQNPEIVIDNLTPFLGDHELQIVTGILHTVDPQILFYRESFALKPTISFQRYDDEYPGSYEFNIRVSKKKLRNILEALLGTGNFYGNDGKSPLD
jgi:hypothetical protein